MPRYYPMKPTKRPVNYRHDTFGVVLLSILVGALCMFLSVISLIFLGVPSKDTIVPTVILSAGFGGGILTFLKLRFEHIPRRIKAHFAYTKDMKEYNRIVAEVNLHGDRADSEAFIKLLKTGTVTRRSYEP